MPQTYGCCILLLFGTIQNCVYPRIPCYNFGWFSALQFVSSAPEMLAETKTLSFYIAFFSSFIF